MKRPYSWSGTNTPPSVVIVKMKNEMRCAWMIGYDPRFNCQHVKMKNRLGEVLILPLWLSLYDWMIKMKK